MKLISNFDVLILGGYGHFIWPAFIFTFFSCFILYLKTKKELSKQEKVFFASFKESKVLHVEASSKKNTKFHPFFMKI